MKKPVLFRILLGLMLFIYLAIPCSAAENVLVFDNCDSAGGWHNGPVNDRAVFVEGKGSIKFTVNNRSTEFVVYKPFSKPVDASATTAIEFEFFISDIALMDKNTYFALEISSSGTWDKEEIEWSDALKYNDFAEGWNHIALFYSEGSDIGIDLSRINFIRMFMLGISGVESEITLRLDNIVFTDKTDPNANTSKPLPPAPRLVSVTPETAALPGGAVESKPDEKVDSGADKSEPAESGMGSIDITDGSDEGQTVKSRSVSSFVLFTLIPFIAGTAAIVLAIKLSISQKGKQALFVTGVVLVISGLTLLVAGIAATPPEGLRYGEQTTDTQEEDDTTETKNDKAIARDPYKILFTEETDMSLPHVLMKEQPEENGVAVSLPKGGGYRYLKISGRDSWIIEREKKEGTGQLYLDFDEFKDNKLSGGNATLLIYYFADQSTGFSATYENAFGEKVEERVQLMTTGAWAKATIPISNAVFENGVEGHDMLLKLKGYVMLRIASISLMPAQNGEEYAEAASLVVPAYENQTYIVADVNVKYYGAAGNGKSDDTAAFRAALAYVSSLGGGTVFVPQGKYAITSYLDIPTGCQLVGELEEGTANGTVLCAYWGKNSESAESFIRMKMGSSLKNVAIWYPEQEFINGKPIPYPYAIEQTGTEGVDIENVTLVNAYNGIDFAVGSDSLQTVRRLYGTILKNGYTMNACYDIGRLENIIFSPDIWLSSGLDNLPSPQMLRNWMLTNAVGMTISRVDWTYFADIKIEGYNIGIKFTKSADGSANGHIYNLKIYDCFYGLYADVINGIGLMVSDAVITTGGGEGSVAVFCTENFDSDISFNSSHIESEGKYAIYNAGSGVITASDSAIKSAGTMYIPEDRYSFINVALDMPGAGSYKVMTGKTPKLEHALAKDGANIGIYSEYKVTKPASAAFVDLSAEPYSAKRIEGDISSALQSAIDSIKETGGIIYLPTGKYYVEQPINVWSGIELRGSADAPHFNGVTSATIMTDYGRDDPDGAALFTLYEGAGMRGMNIYYYNQKTVDIRPYAFSIRGNGSDIYICNMMMSSSYNLVDFTTYRCDKHYVEYIWGAPAYRGIVVGAGSTGGIIRDCQFTPNCWHGNGVVWNEAYQFIMANAEQFVIGDSEGEILYHNFTYGAYRGLTLEEGARNVYIVGHGVDSGNIAAYAQGDAQAVLVNTQLVNLGKADLNYVFTDKTFTGNLQFINTNMWGTPKNAVIKNGIGKVEFLSGTVSTAGERFITATDGSVYVAGVRVKQRAIKSDLYISGNTLAQQLGNIFGSGGKYTILDEAVLEDLTK